MQYLQNWNCNRLMVDLYIKILEKLWIWFIWGPFICLITINLTLTDFFTEKNYWICHWHIWNSPKNLLFDSVYYVSVDVTETWQLNFSKPMICCSLLVCKNLWCFFFTLSFYLTVSYNIFFIWDGVKLQHFKPSFLCMI